MPITATPRGYIERPRPSGLADVIDVILDKGMVIDAYIRVALVGIELLTIDARIVVASMDTYLRFASAVNRLEIGGDEAEGLPQLISSIASEGAESKTEGAIKGVKDEVTGDGGGGRAALSKVKQKLTGEDDEGEDAEDDDEDEGRQPSGKSSEQARSRSQSSNRGRGSRGSPRRSSSRRSDRAGSRGRQGG